MFNTFPPHHRTGSWRLVLPLILGGCSAPVVPERPAARSAQVTLVNHTDYTWQISLAGPGAPASTRVEANRTVTWEVPGGRYRIEQVILNPTERPTLPRSFAAELMPGKRYSWPLLTLQSDPGGSSGNETDVSVAP